MMIARSTVLALVTAVSPHCGGPRGARTGD